jgi:hypothetical protein
MDDEKRYKYFSFSLIETNTLKNVSWYHFSKCLIKQRLPGTDDAKELPLHTGIPELTLIILISSLIFLLR